VITGSGPVLGDVIQWSICKWTNGAEIGVPRRTLSLQRLFLLRYQSSNRPDGSEPGALALEEPGLFLSGGSSGPFEGYAQPYLAILYTLADRSIHPDRSVT